MEINRKAEVFSSNADAIERALDEAIHTIEASDIDNPSVDERDFFFDLQLMDTNGNRRDCVLSYKFFPLNYSKLYDIYIYIRDKHTKEKIAFRSYFFPQDALHQEDGVNTAVNRSTVEVVQMNRSGIASALISKGEDIRAVTARKVAGRFGLETITSRFVDDSDPRLWTTDSALALGYTFVGEDEEGYSIFEKVDDLSRPFSKQNINLARYWNKNRNAFGRVKRILTRSFAR